MFSVIKYSMSTREKESYLRKFIETDLVKHFHDAGIVDLSPFGIMVCATNNENLGDKPLAVLEVAKKSIVSLVVAVSNEGADERFSMSVYPGKTTDLRTMQDMGKKLQERFGPPIRSRSSPTKLAPVFQGSPEQRRMDARERFVRSLPPHQFIKVHVDPERPPVPRGTARSFLKGYKDFKTRGILYVGEELPDVRAQLLKIKESKAKKRNSTSPTDRNAVIYEIIPDPPSEKEYTCVFILAQSEVESLLNQTRVTR